MEAQPTRGRSEETHTLPNIEPSDLSELPDDVADELRALQKERGYVPYARLTLARRPKTMRALRALSETVMRDGTVDPGLKYLVAVVSSAAAGCVACQANASFGAVRAAGVSAEKIEDVWGVRAVGPVLGC